MNFSWQRAQADIENQPKQDVDQISINKGDGLALVARMRSAIARADRVEAALAELRELYKDRESDLDFEYNRAQKAESELEILQARTFAARSRAERAEAALAERDKSCECGMLHDGQAMHGNRYCPNCGHLIEIAAGEDGLERSAETLSPGPNLPGTD